MSAKKRAASGVLPSPSLQQLTHRQDEEIDLSSRALVESCLLLLAEGGEGGRRKEGVGVEAWRVLKLLLLDLGVRFKGCLARGFGHAGLLEIA